MILNLCFLNVLLNFFSQKRTLHLCIITTRHWLCLELTHFSVEMGQYYDKHPATGSFYDATLNYLSLKKISKCLFYLTYSYITFIPFLNAFGCYYLLLFPEKLHFKMLFKGGLVSIIYFLNLFWLRSHLIYGMI